MPENTRNRLVVDDNELNYTAVRKLLTKEGYNVTVAVDGLQAMEMLMNNSSYDLVVTDMMMPQVTGQQLLEAIKRNLYSKIKVIVISSMQNETMIADAFKAGADDYLIKPINPTDLLQRVRKILN